MTINLCCCNRYGGFTKELLAIATNDPFDLELEASNFPVKGEPFEVMLESQEISLRGYRTRAVRTGSGGNIYWQTFHFSNLFAAHFLTYAMGIGFKATLVSEPLPLDIEDRPFTIDEFIDAIDPSLKLENLYKAWRIEQGLEEDTNNA